DPFEGVVAEDDLAGGGQGRLAEHTVVGVRPTLVDGVRGVDEPVELFVGDVAGEVAQPVLQVVAGIHRYPSQAQWSQPQYSMTTASSSLISSPPTALAKASPSGLRWAGMVW